MSWRLYRPRRIATYEARIIQRVLKVGAHVAPSVHFLDTIPDLIVHEEGDGGGFQHDSLDFVGGLFQHGRPIASAVGTMANDAQVELIVWAQGDVITRLELEPFDGARLPARMPILESILPYPPNDSSGDEEDADTPVF